MLIKAYNQDKAQGPHCLPEQRYQTDTTIMQILIINQVWKYLYNFALSFFKSNFESLIKNKDFYYFLNIFLCKNCSIVVPPYIHG